MNRSLALARLFRLPNVFTAVADISVGLIIGRGEVYWHHWIVLPIASACFYSAGMAWNDYFDRHIDKVERPNRPIPSGNISPRRAKWFGILLAATGLFLSACAGFSAGGWSPLPLIIAVALLATILAYNGWLKGTLFGPWVMGGCRFLNMMLGFSVLSADLMPWLMRLHAALALGLYVTGITYIARDEVSVGQRNRLLNGAVISILGCALLAFLGTKSPAFAGTPTIYLAAFFIVTFLTRFANIRPEPTPERTQHFVKTAILGIIVFDAILATGLAGPMGLVIVIWLIPALILGRWVYST